MVIVVLITHEQVIMKVKHAQLSHFQGSQNEKRRATEMVIAAKINSEQPYSMGKTLKELRKEVVEI